MDLKLIESLRKGVCQIEEHTQYPTALSSAGSKFASGFVIDSNRGLICTCKHVANRFSSQVVVEFENGYRTKAEVVYTDPRHDLSFLLIEGEWGEEFSGFKLQRSIRPHEDVLLVGSSEGYKFYLTKGQVVDTKSLIGFRDSLGFQTNLSTAGGTSGSPIFNQYGELIGMHTSGTEKSSFELNINVILYCLDLYLGFKTGIDSEITFLLHNKFELAAGKMVDLSLMGETEASKLLVVRQIDPFSPAKNKLLPGDVLHTIQGRRIICPFEAQKTIDQFRGEVRVEVFRLGRLVRLELSYRQINLQTQKLLLWNDCVFQETDEEIRKYFGIEASGVFLSFISDSSPLDGIGAPSIRSPHHRGLLVTRFNGQRIESLQDFESVLTSFSGDYLAFNFIDYINYHGEVFCLTKCRVEYPQIIDLKQISKKDAA